MTTANNTQQQTQLHNNTLQFDYRDKNAIDQFAAFVKGLTPKDRVMIVHDSDGDGITSSTILARMLKRIGSAHAGHYFYNRVQRPLSTEEAAHFKSHGYTYLITCDVPIASASEIEPLQEYFEKIVIFDHHPWDNSLLQDDVILLKSDMLFAMNRPEKYCTAKLVYDVCSHIDDCSQDDWIALAGMIADIATEPFEDFVKDVAAKYDVPITNMADPKFSSSNFGRVVNSIGYATAMSPHALERTWKEVYAAKEWKDLETTLQENLVVGDTAQKYIDNFEDYAEKLGDNILFLEIEDCEYSIKKQVSTVTSLQRIPDKTLCVLQKRRVDPNTITGSLRRQDHTVAMNDLIKRVTSQMDNADGGGHYPAAGFRFQTKDLARFKELLLKEHP